MSKNSSLFAVLLFLAFSHSGVASAETWYVNAGATQPRDGKSFEAGFETIQEGIDAASPGDTVIVAEGTYVENIQFKGKNITLGSTEPTDPTVVENTVIDGKRSGSVVAFAGTEDETCVLSGFTIRKGRADHGGGICGGTEFDHTHATIENNIISANSAGDGGGLAYCDGAIQNNVITGNMSWREWRGGAGLYDCDGTIENNTISGNSATGDWNSGGGLRSCDGTIQNNTITGNRARSAGGLANCSGVIQNNTISGNPGGGLSECYATIQNNIISGNTAKWGSGGLYQCHWIIRNNTVFGNSLEDAGAAGGGMADCKGTIQNCIIWGNRGLCQISDCSVPIYSCIQAWTGGGQGNIAHHPYFVDAPNGDYHLKSWSPCIDAGAPGSPCWEEPAPSGGRINIGAYGNTPEATSKSADSDNDGLADDWEMEFFRDLRQEASDDADGDLISNIEEYDRGLNPTCQAALWYVDGSVPTSGDGTCWETAFKTIQEGINAASDGDTVIVAQGTYLENIHFNGKEIILRSTDPADPAVVDNAIIDGNQAASVVTFDGTEDETCVFSGFTVRNGKARHGGGISGGSAMIENNVITGNSAQYYGGGLYYCQGTMRNNIISGNAAGYGGGLHSCHGTIQNNTVSDNAAESYGGGLFACPGTIRRNTITGNSARRGGGLYYCDGTIESNTISGNSADADGGGLSWCKGTIRNNVITGNSAERDGGGLHWCRRDGLHCCDGIIWNNTITENSAGRNGGGLCEFDGTIANCIIWGNRAAEGAQLYDSSVPRYSCIQNWTAAGEGNISQDPRFVDPDGPDDDPETYQDNDYRLAEASPCIDAGVNEDWMMEAVDLDGNPRIVDGDRDRLAVADMGAYEYVPPLLISVRSNTEADFVLKRLPGGHALQGSTEATGDPKVFEKVYANMPSGTWHITWQSQSGAWPRKPVNEEKELADGGAIVFEKNYIVRMPSETYQLDIEPVRYTTGTFPAHVRLKNTTGPENPPARTFTTPIWLVVKDVVFTVSGPDSEGKLWNADGISSEEYPHSGDYYYVDVSDWAPLGPGETSPEVVLEFYIKDRNPNFEPEIEVWAYDPVVVAAGSRFRVERVLSEPAGSILLQWESEEGAVYVVEAAASLQGPWVPIADEIPSGGQITQWADWLPEGITCRFYRIRGPSP